MEEQNNRKENESNPKDQSVPGNPISGAVNIDAKNSRAHRSEGNRNINPIEKTLADRIRQAEIWMIVLTAIIASATAANVIVFYLESESTSKQIVMLSSKAGEIVGAMNTALGDNQAAINRAFLENQRALEASRVQSKAALDASIDTLRTDQRAWLSVGSIGPGEIQFVVGKPFVTSLGVLNTGKTPTRHTTSQYVSAVTTTKQPDVKLLPAPQNVAVIGIGGAGTRLGSRDPDAAWRLTQAQFDAVRSHALNIFIYGRINYDDVFGFHHWIMYCYAFNPSNNEMEYCASHNDMDKELR